MKSKQPDRAEEETSRAPTRLRELAGLFLKLGVIGFGGPAAHVALMEDEVVRRRGWMSREEFLDLLGATNLIPGPNSTEMAIHIGRRQAGWQGLLVAGTCFIVPAMAMILGIGWLYVNYRRLPAMDGVMYGVKPVIIGIVLRALWVLGRSATKNLWLGTLGGAALAAVFLGVNELLVLLACGVAAGAIRRIQSRAGLGNWGLLFGAAGMGSIGGGVASAAGAAPFGLGALFLFFLKVGSVLFGSGYVLLAFLRSDLVERWHWLSESQLLDAIAVGQVTPGPLFTTATFIGYLLGGVPGALVGTVGIFLPAFVFVAFSGPMVPRLRKSPLAGAILDGVNIGSLALMVAVTWHLGGAAIIDGPSFLLAAAATVLAFWTKVNSVWIVAGGAVTGLLAQLR